MNTETTIIAAATETKTPAAPAKTKAKVKRSATPKVAKVAKALPAKAPTPAKPKAKTGEVAFKPGTKRRACFDALVRKEGVTLAQAHEFLGWATSVCGSEMREVAKLTSRKLVREGGVYRLV